MASSRGPIKLEDSPFDPNTYGSTARALDGELVSLCDPAWSETLVDLLADRELLAMQKWANSVAVRRLRHNDHGPVHMRIVALNGVRILRCLQAAGVQPSVEADEGGGRLHAEIAVVLAALTHDVGMGVTRQNHEWHSIELASNLVDRWLESIFPDDTASRIVVRALWQEAVVGHMGHEKIHSVEAGVVLVADGTDMTEGRSRLVGILHTEPAVGDMHKLSADSITAVSIAPGDRKPVSIVAAMRDRVGIFQVEQVLMQKVDASPIKHHLEIAVDVEGEERRRYLT